MNIREKIDNAIAQIQNFTRERFGGLIKGYCERIYLKLEEKGDDSKHDR